MADRMSTVLTPRGNVARFVTRDDTNDEALLVGILGGDEYRLGSLPSMEGWALDVGAHIGTVAIALAVDNPGLMVLAVEPVPDNCRVIRESIRANGLGARVVVVEMAAEDPDLSTAPCRYGWTEGGPGSDPGYVEQNRYIGNIIRSDVSGAVGERIDVPVVGIRALADIAGVERFAFTKLDCEGCEWGLLSRDADLLGLIMGEWHDSPLSRMEEILRGTHDVQLVEDYGGSGIFRAVPR